MGVIWGRLYPTEGYSIVRRAFLLFADAKSGNGSAVDEKKLEEYRSVAAHFSLSVATPDGQVLPVEVDPIVGAKSGRC